ncbi:MULTISPECIES: hypothetical protein [unclassified Enterococcus]|uniref:hypothetical protein n=1 Tax=Enterococcus TaxID=1350 RepID=UPI0020A1CFD6|nr:MULTISPECIES: hypothetical protein [unclassified Enterococcus]
MNYVKRIFSIFILFIISQIGITAFGVIKQLSLDAGEKNLNISSTLVTVILVVINILFLIYLAKRMNIIKTNHPFLTKKNILIILVATLIDRGIAVTFLFKWQKFPAINDKSYQLWIAFYMPITKLSLAASTTSTVILSI